MDNYANIILNRSSIVSDAHRAPSRKGERSYIHKRSNVRNKLVIEVQPSTNKNLLTSQPTTVKTQLREILNNAENYYNLSDFCTGDSSKTKSRQLSVKREEDENKKGKILVGEFEMQKMKLKLDNLRLPKISEEKVRSGSIKVRARPKNNSISIDYNRSQKNNQTMDNATLDAELQGIMENLQERLGQPQTSKAQRPNPIMERVERVEKVPEKPVKVQVQQVQPKQEVKQEAVNEKQLTKKPSENADYFNQETYRTLTSVFSSRRSLVDPFEEIRNENKDPKKAIKNVAEKHVELAYKKIDQIKRNFHHRRAKTYWFNVPTSKF